MKKILLVAAISAIVSGTAFADSTRTDVTVGNIDVNAALASQGGAAATNGNAASDSFNTKTITKTEDFATGANQAVVLNNGSKIKDSVILTNGGLVVGGDYATSSAAGSAQNSQTQTVPGNQSQSAAANNSALTVQKGSYAPDNRQVVGAPNSITTGWGSVKESNVVSAPNNVIANDGKLSQNSNNKTKTETTTTSIPVNVVVDHNAIAVDSSSAAVNGATANTSLGYYPIWW